MRKTVNNRSLGILLCIGLLAGMQAHAQSLVPAVDYTIEQMPVYESASKVVLRLDPAVLAACAELKAVLVQSASALAAILDERSAIDCKADAAGELPFRFVVPEVARPTRFAWEFQACDTRQQCNPAGTVEFIALPPDYLQPVIEWSRKHTLFVADADGWLVAFLDRLGVEYTQNRREAAAETDIVSLVTMTAPDTVRQDMPHGRFKRIIEFHDYPSVQPLVWVDSSPEGVVIAVRFPLIHEIARDAANKKIFYELFQRLFR